VVSGGQTVGAARFPVARELMALAPSAPLTAQVRGLLSASDHALVKLKPCRETGQRVWECRVAPAVRSMLERLRHPLSAYVVPPTFDTDALDRAETEEARLYQRWRASFAEFPGLADLRSFIALSLGGSGSLRSTPVWLRSRDGQTRIPMVSAQAAIQRIAVLPGRLACGELGNGVLAAVRILALINNAHAFTDGNGRLGRALFNFCLHRRGMPTDCFIPLKTLAALSGGGYEIRLREAELLGRWDGLYSYHCTAVRLYARLGRTRSIASRPGREA